MRVVDGTTVLISDTATFSSRVFATQQSKNWVWISYSENGGALFIARFLVWYALVLLRWRAVRLRAVGFMPIYSL